MPLVLSGATSGSTTIQATDAVTATLTLPSSTGTLLSTANPQSGGVIQVVQANTSTQSTTSSTSFVATNLTASITPKFSTSKILVQYSVQTTNTSAGNSTYHNIYRNSSPLINSTSGYEVYQLNTGSYVWGVTNFSYLDSPATTSSTTYTIYQKVNGGTGYFVWGDGSIATITLMEIAA
jgi:hypothetical protein